MKKIASLVLLLFISILTYEQEQFTSKGEALTYLKGAFSKYFVKEKVTLSNVKMFDDVPQYFSYEFTDRYLLISRTVKNSDMLSSYFMLIPFDKISRITPVINDAYFAQSTHLFIKSNCRCFKYTSGKKFNGEEKYDEVKDLQVIPFNLTDEDKIGESLTNAFKTLAGSNFEQ